MSPTFGERRPAPRRSVCAALSALIALSACAPAEEILPGPRFDARETDAAAEALARRADGTPVAFEPGPQPVSRTPQRPYAVTGSARAFAAPAPRTNADWTHIGGAADHKITHPALDADLTRVWSADIGRAGSRRIRVTADPVVAGGRIFTMSAYSQVQATSMGGEAAWRRDLTPASDNPGEASGGGLAIDNGRLYVTTGYGTLHALDARTGATIWQQDLGAAPNSAPTIAGNFVYLTSRDGTGWAIDTATGRVAWQTRAGNTQAVVIDGASPAVADGTVVFPFGSGELIGALRQSGTPVWSAFVAGGRTGYAYARIGDITADPVIDGGSVYTGTPTGRLAALSLETGTRAWSADIGANSAVWPSGGSLFLVSDLAELMRLDASTGNVIWSATLPLYTAERVRARNGIFAHYGPILTGNRLILASSDGLLRQVAPQDGRLLAQTELGAPAAANPVVANGALFVVTSNGQLQAFR